MWPGWGHASENYKLPLALSKSPRRPVWIGPSVSSMLLLGDKIGSIIIAQFVNVPCVPWSGSHVRCSAEDLEGNCYYLYYIYIQNIIIFDSFFFSWDSLPRPSRSSLHHNNRRGVRYLRTFGLSIDDKGLCWWWREGHSKSVQPE